VYTMRGLMKIWWEEPAGGAKTKSDGDRLIIPALLVGTCLVLGVWAEPLVNLSQRIVSWLGNPAFYIQAVFGG